MIDIMTSVIEQTANQLGVSKDQVTLETVVPDIHQLAFCVAMDTGKIISISDFQAQYTVEQAITEFER